MLNIDITYNIEQIDNFFDEEKIKEDNNRLLDNINAGRVDEKSGITRGIRIAGKKFRKVP